MRFVTAYEGELSLPVVDRPAQVGDLVVARDMVFEVDDLDGKNGAMRVIVGFRIDVPNAQARPALLKPRECSVVAVGAQPKAREFVAPRRRAAGRAQQGLAP